jgi:hypothetical protein
MYVIGMTTVIQGTGGGLELFCYNTWVSRTQKMLGTRSVSNFVGFFLLLLLELSLIKFWFISGQHHFTHQAGQNK